MPARAISREAAMGGGNSSLDTQIKTAIARDPEAAAAARARPGPASKEAIDDAEKKSVIAAVAKTLPARRGEPAKGKGAARGTASKAAPARGRVETNAGQRGGHAAKGGKRAAPLDPKTVRAQAKARLEQEREARLSGSNKAMDDVLGDLLDREEAQAAEVEPGPARKTRKPARRVVEEDEDDDEPKVDLDPVGEDEDDDEEERDTPAIHSEEITEDDLDDDEIAELEEEEPDRPTQDISIGKARRILRLEGWTTEMLDRHPEEDLVQLASHRSGVRADVDARLRRLNELETQHASAAKPPSNQPSQVPPTAPTDLAHGFDAKKATTKMREQGYGAEADALEEGLTAVAAYAQSLVQGQVQKLQPLIAELGKREIRNARATLEGQYPELADPERGDRLFRRVLEKAQSPEMQGYEDYGSLLSDSAAIVLSGSRRASRAQAAANRARAAGQLPVSTRTRATPKRTSGDRMDAIINALEEQDLEEAERIARSVA